MSQVRQPRDPESLSPFTRQDVVDAGLRDECVITLEPLVLMLPHEGSVVSRLDGPLVVHDSKQAVPVVKVRRESWIKRRQTCCR